MQLVRLARTVLLAVAWLAVAAIVSIGAAGVVASMNHMPSTAARPELTWAADRRAEPALDAVTVQLQGLSDQVDQLSGIARDALTQVVGGDLVGLGTTIATGTNQVASVQRQAASLDQALAAVPGAGPDRELRLSPGLIARYDALAGTSDLTSTLDGDWASFTGRALDAAGLTGLLARHDRETAAAAAEGSAAHYRKALTLLDRSDATIAQTQALRDRLAKASDVSTLSAWVDRNATYDAALRNLYQSLLDSKGHVTDRVRKAFQIEQAARSQLPTDTRGLVVIMSDLAQGGLNQALIAIEQARGALSDALDRQRQLTTAPDQAPSPSP